MVAVLAEIGAGSLPTLEVWNKIDRLPASECPVAGSNRIAVSALHGTGMEELRSTIWTRLGLDTVATEVRVPVGDGAFRAWLYRNGEVEAETVDANGAMTVAVRLDRDKLDQLERERPSGRHVQRSL